VVDASIAISGVRMTVVERVNPGTARRAARLFVPYRWQLLLVVLAILIASGLWVVVPFLTQAIFDRALFAPGGVRLGLIVELVAAMIVVSSAASLINFGHTCLTTWVGNQVLRDLRNRLFAHLQSMHFGFFTGTRTGEVQARLGSDVGGVQTAVTDTAATILSNAVTVFASIVGMLLLSWQLSILALALLPLFVFLQVHVGRVRQRVAASTQTSLSDMTVITQESLSVSGMLLSKAFDRRSYEIERYRRENGKQTALQIRQTITGQRLFAVVFTFLGITPALVYLAVGLAAAHGQPLLSAGTLIAFLALQSRLPSPIVQLLGISLELQTSLALFARIFEYLDLRPAVVDAPRARAVSRTTVRGEVALEHVWFRYPSDQSIPEPGDDGRGWVLRDLTLRVESGQLAAVVGPSGAGKTTLSYLIPRLFDVDRGRVKLDGTDVRELTQASLWSVIGMVTQETYLFHASIRDNLRYANLDATDEQLAAAAEAANIHKQIMSFPQGYDTVVGERGFRLSGGERQRLAIARVILADPKVLILDEATSALDTTNERLVQEALEEVMRNRTTIAIAHRLSTILAADVIFTLRNGRLIEQGTHAQLVRAGQLYASLYDEQFADRAHGRPFDPRGRVRC
jgi:ATP-binding cassette subfamily B protein